MNHQTLLPHETETSASDIGERHTELANQHWDRSKSLALAEAGADVAPALRGGGDTQERAAALYADRRRWAETAIRNVAAMGFFSSDRAIRRYADEIWKLEQVPVAAG